jgi:hypothetical protein
LNEWADSSRSERVSGDPIQVGSGEASFASQFAQKQTFPAGKWLPAPREWDDQSPPLVQDSYRLTATIDYARPPRTIRQTA